MSGAQKQTEDPVYTPEQLSLMNEAAKGPKALAPKPAPPSGGVGAGWMSGPPVQAPGTSVFGDDLAPINPALPAVEPPPARVGVPALPATPAGNAEDDPRFKTGGVLPLGDNRVADFVAANARPPAAAARPSNRAPGGPSTAGEAGKPGALRLGGGNALDLEAPAPWKPAYANELAQREREAGAPSMEEFRRLAMEALSDKGGPVNTSIAQRLVGTAASSVFGPATPQNLGEPWGVRAAAAKNPGALTLQPGQEGYDQLNPYAPHDPRTGAAIDMGDKGRWSTEVMSKINAAEAGSTTRGLQYLDNPEQYIGADGRITPEGQRAVAANNARMEAEGQRKVDALDLQRDINGATSYRWNGAQAPMTATRDTAGIAALRSANNAANRVTPEGEANRNLAAETARLNREQEVVLQDQKLTSDQKIERLKALTQAFNTAQTNQTSRDVAGTQADATRDSANIHAGASRDVATTQADASRYGADKSLEGHKYGANAAADASRYGADKSVEAAAARGSEGYTKQQRSNAFQEAWKRVQTGDVAQGRAALKEMFVHAKSDPDLMAQLEELRYDPVVKEIWAKR